MAVDNRREYRYAGYAPRSASSYVGNTARRLDRWADSPQPDTRRSRERRVNPEVKVREAGKLSPFAVVGFLAVCGMVIVMLMSYATLTAANDTVVQLRSDLSDLKEEESKLLTQYEMSFNLQEIEEQMLSSGAMVKMSGQPTMLDVTEPDTVKQYQTNSQGGLWGAVKPIVDSIAAYF